MPGEDFLMRKLLVETLEQINEGGSRSSSPATRNRARSALRKPHATSAGIQQYTIAVALIRRY